MPPPSASILDLAIAAKDDGALVVIDVQNDFFRGGALVVPNAEDILPLINALAKLARHIVVTQDWHPRRHLSFASSHPGKKPLDEIEVAYGRQTLWPDHCVPGTPGAEFHPQLDLSRAELILRKGFHPEIDSYSAFFENDRTTPTGLAGYLRERGISELFLVGVATDFCVAYTALDARRLGFAVTVIESACRAIDTGGSLDAAWKQMLAAGVVRA